MQAPFLIIKFRRLGESVVQLKKELKRSKNPQLFTLGVFAEKGTTCILRDSNPGPPGYEPDALTN